MPVLSRHALAEAVLGDALVPAALPDALLVVVFLFPLGIPARGFRDYAVRESFLIGGLFLAMWLQKDL